MSMCVCVCTFMLQLYIYIYVCIYYIHTYIYMTLKKVYNRNVVNKYGLCSLLGVIIYNLIDYILYIYICSDM